MRNVYNKGFNVYNKGFSSSSSSSDDESTNYEPKTSSAIINRPYASPGYWLCCLVPLAFVVTCLKQQPCNPYTNYKMLTIASLGMCVESLCFFLYMFVNTGLLLKLFISFVPGLLTTFLFFSWMQHKLVVAFFWGFAVTFFYQNVYIRVLRGFPQCFTYGEACVLVQGLTLFFMNCILQFPELLLSNNAPANEFMNMNAIMMGALFCLLVTCWLLATFQKLRQVYFFYPLMCLLVLAVTTIPFTKPMPIITIYDFISKNHRRIFIIIFYIGLVGATILAVRWQLGNTEKASTRMRKIFHLLVVLVYVPGMLYQCTLLYIGSGVALAFITVLELFRILDIPPLANGLKSSFASFSDEKDAGNIAFTPFCLLIGVSLPLWIGACPCGDILDSVKGLNFLSIMAGILTVGIGDTAASFIGSICGRLRWKNSTRSIEGTFAYVLSVSLAVYAFYAFGFVPMCNHRWIVTAAATIVSSLVEAHTNQIDNLVLPLIFYIMGPLNF